MNLKETHDCVIGIRRISPLEVAKWRVHNNTFPKNIAFKSHETQFEPGIIFFQYL
jgi:hypothetical protein